MAVTDIHRHRLV